MFLYNQKGNIGSSSRVLHRVNFITGQDIVTPDKGGFFISVNERIARFTSYLNEIIPIDQVFFRKVNLLLHTILFLFDLVGFPALNVLIRPKRVHPAVHY
jgi:hypothetical protein